MLANRQAAFGIQRQAVRAGLTIFANVRAGVTGLAEIHADVALRCHAVNHVVVGIAEQQIPLTFVHPHGAFGERETFGQLFEFRVGGQHGVQRGVLPLHVELHRARLRQPVRRVEIDRGAAQPDVGIGVRGDGAVDAENRNLKRLAGPGVAREHDAVGRVPTGGNAAAVLPEHPRSLAVHPDLGIIVQHHFEHSRRTACVQAADSLRNRDIKPIPDERKPPIAAPLFERRGRDDFPPRIIEAFRARIRREVKRAVLQPAGPEVRADAAVLDFVNVRIAITPLRLHQCRALGGAQVGDGIGQHGARSVVGANAAVDEQQRRRQKWKCFHVQCV
ncbi:MAG: hypothetical protein AB1705_14465 [Verrucomicrobiota bacterium]